MSISRLIKSIKDDPKLAHSFDNTPNAPNELINNLESARSGAKIGLKELIDIATVKSLRRIELIKINECNTVRAITQLAFNSEKIQDETVRIGILCALHGVRVPMASAILSWVYPDRWAVIDRRSWSALAHFNLVNGSVSSRLSPNNWATYCKIMKELSQATGQTPQWLDRWLYSFARKNNLGA